MSTEKGSLSISSENIFPIIKKWLYNDQDIFMREMISNACDAITKLRKLEIMGEYQFPEDHRFEIQVVADPQKKTLKLKSREVQSIRLRIWSLILGTLKISLKQRLISMRSFTSSTTNMIMTPERATIVLP